MKKIMSFLFALMICISQFNFASAQDNYTVKNSAIKSSEDFLSINISVPYFEGFLWADKINKEIKDLVADSIGEARTAEKSMEQLNDEYIKNGEELWASKIVLDINYDYFLDKDIVSLRLNMYTYSGGAHGAQFIIPITANTSTGELYAFKDLFKEDTKSIEIIENKLIETMNKNPSNYFEDYAKVVKDKNGDFNFYIDGNKLIVYFNLYDIAPYAAGIHHFVFEGNELKEILKDEIFNSMKDSSSLDAIRFNGTSLQSKESIINKDIPIVPLRVIAESLGYKVDWNEKDGPIIGGKPITGIEYKIIKGITYVPIQYFTEVLKRNVSLGSFLYINTGNKKYDLNDNTIVRIFDESNHLDPYYDLISEFVNPSSALECVEAYGNAVKRRNGAIQYALLSNDLKEKSYQNFKDHIFVTGQSSPWVGSYDIKELEDNSFQITFHLETSIPNDVMADTVANIKIIEDGLTWRISYLETNQH